MPGDELAQLPPRISARAEDSNRKFMHDECIKLRSPAVNGCLLAPGARDRYSLPMANKRERQATIRSIIDSRPIESQEELRKQLRQRGWDVTQSTLSRDLREMRVSRIPVPGGGSRYSITSDDGDARPPLQALLPPLYTAIDGVGELIVLHTLPGGAQPIGVALDAEEWPEVMGTIAGDDTVLIVCRSSAAMEKVIKRLKSVAGPAPA